MKCNLLTDPNRKRCVLCEKLVNIFRLKKHRYDISKTKLNPYISKVLTPNKRRSYCGILKQKNYIRKKNIRYLIYNAVDAYLKILKKV